MSDGAENTRVQDGATNGATGYLVRMLVVGLIVSVALGLTLLTWALPLMAMLGVFFFMLFGLLVGACMFRAGAAGRPLPKRGLVVVTVLVSLAGWSTAVLKEAIDFPEDFVAAALDPKNPPRRQLHIVRGEYDQVEKQLQDYIPAYMAEHYPPGGLLGYFKMASTGGAVEIDLADQPRKIVRPPRAPAWLWWMRVVLALLLYYMTMFSVAGGLRNKEDPQRRRKSSGGDEQAALDEAGNPGGPRV